MRNAAALAVSLALCFAAAGAGGYWTTLGLDSWYPTLNKPPWNPPDRVFGPVWTILYVSMAVVAWLVWKRDGVAGAKLPLALFALQLVLNAAWTGCFFALRNLGLALAEIAALWVVLLATLVAFWRRTIPAGALLVPYLAWVSFASALNYAIWSLN